VIHEWVQKNEPKLTTDVGQWRLVQNRALIWDVKVCTKLLEWMQWRHASNQCKLKWLRIPHSGQVAYWYGACIIIKRLYAHSYSMPTIEYRDRQPTSRKMNSFVLIVYRYRRAGHSTVLLRWVWSQGHEVSTYPPYLLRETFRRSSGKLFALQHAHYNDNMLIHTEYL